MAKYLAFSTPREMRLPIFNDNNNLDYLPSRFHTAIYPCSHFAHICVDSLCGEALVLR